ncbi:uncharacterized protein LOC122068686 [Macadamia integrifolia]|uniref:uncharacterized protein LOC122068686 n=1 Tax=Macadamia integrifolia TaxID=60698 RepID=UPI001C4F9B3D|nr:uncharacterized protein LOC122068686 [Macadamia integrifolia]
MGEYYGVTVTCDGWTRPTRQSIINFKVNCDGRTIFLQSVDASSEKKDAKYIYNLLKEVAKDVRVKNVVQIVTDNGRNVKKSRERLMTNRMYHLFWTPYASQCIDLMLKDMGNLKAVKSVVEKARQVTTYVYNHGFALNLLRTKCGGHLVSPWLTRFVTNYITLKSFEMKKSGLRSVFALDEWFNWDGSNSQGGKAAQATIASEKFWDDLKKVVRILDSIVNILKLVESQKKPTLPIIWAAIEMMKMEVDVVYR